jgi:hypothetical protein
VIAHVSFWMSSLTPFSMHPIMSFVSACAALKSAMFNSCSLNLILRSSSEVAAGGGVVLMLTGVQRDAMPLHEVGMPSIVPISGVWPSLVSTFFLTKCFMVVSHEIALSSAFSSVSR